MSAFFADYHSDRAAFLGAARAYAERSGRLLALHSHVVDAQADLAVTIAELPARNPQRVLALCTGTHGIEGYAGSAVARALLAQVFDGLDPDTASLLIVHALNPYGFANFARVNAHNVDLNRNCQVQGERLFETDSGAFDAMSALLSPVGPLQVRVASRLRFGVGLARALLAHGAPLLRQASLSGQYSQPRGVFYGGAQVEPEIAFFQGVYERVVSQHPEVLFVDLHTGYGEHGQAYPLFAQTESAALRALVSSGVTDDRGRDKTYFAHGDLVGYCYKTAKRLSPRGIFNGLVVEIGTHGLSTFNQMRDLFIVVCDNQWRQFGSADAASERWVRDAFRGLFYPRSAQWQQQALRAGVRSVEQLLHARGFLVPGA